MPRQKKDLVNKSENSASGCSLKNPDSENNEGIPIPGENCETSIPATTRDKEYLLAIFLQNGADSPVGPARLAKVFRVSRVSSYQKLKRLVKLGMGKNVPGKGFLLNSEGENVVQNDIHRHHVIEKFFQKELGISSKNACRESEKLSSRVSNDAFNRMDKKLGDETSCECGCCLHPPYKPEDLVECHFCKPYFLEVGGRKSGIT